MNCSDFLDHWNERLDHPELLGVVPRSDLEIHAASCETCRRLATSLLGMTHWPTRPVVPGGFSDRVVAAWEAEATQSARWWRNSRGRLTWAAGLAAAACLALMVSLPRRPPAAIPPAATRSIPATRPWTVALAEATSATLDFARETSRPAARVGQGVLDATGVAEGSWPAPMEVPSPPSEVLQSVSRRVNAGVRPLSGSARRAFSFLVAPQSPPVKRELAPARDSGA